MYTDEKSYLSNNIFLPRINNEGAIKNSSYAENLKRLNRFVLIKFEDDQMIVPKDSAWFDFVNQRNEKLPLKMQGKYLNDELGLKSLDEQGKLVFLTFPGPHMKIDVARFFNEIVPQYLEDGNAKGRLNFELF